VPPVTFEFMKRYNPCTQSNAECGARSAELPRVTLARLRQFIGKSQLAALIQGCRGEEKEFFIAKLTEYADRIAAMPQTGETDGQGDAAIVHLHYFASGRANWYITEKDAEAPDSPGQHQAFGLADLFGDGGELGYISLVEILANGGELDLYWKPKTLGEVKTGKAVAPEISPCPAADSALIKPLLNSAGARAGAERAENAEKRGDGATLSINKAKHLVQLHFPSKPDEATRTKLKAARWRWYGPAGCWYHKHTPENLEWAQAFISPESTVQNPESSEDCGLKTVDAGPSNIIPLAQPVPAWRKRFMQPKS
jgi:hypothetical protein